MSDLTSIWLARKKNCPGSSLQQWGPSIPLRADIVASVNQTKEFIWLIPLQNLALTKSLLTVFIKLLSVISIAKLYAFITVILNREQFKLVMTMTEGRQIDSINQQYPFSFMKSKILSDVWLLKNIFWFQNIFWLGRPVQCSLCGHWPVSLGETPAYCGGNLSSARIFASLSPSFPPPSHSKPHTECSPQSKVWEL